MVREIQIQRDLGLCGNTLKLLKIYESDKYINMLMECQEGGSLGDCLEKQKKFTEEQAKMMMA
jgi:serine/threonine protein kinase